MVNLFLTPRNTEKSETRPGEGSNPNLTSAADLKKMFPRPALKNLMLGLRPTRPTVLKMPSSITKRHCRLRRDFILANNLGTLYLNKGSYEAAQEQFQQAIRLNANDAAAYFNLANLHFLKHEYGDA